MGLERNDSELLFTSSIARVVPWDILLFLFLPSPSHTYTSLLFVYAFSLALALVLVLVFERLYVRIARFVIRDHLLRLFLVSRGASGWMDFLFGPAFLPLCFDCL